VRDEIASVISESKYPDLDISWHLPEVVRHERQYQMQTEALKLRAGINRIERLLGHNLALSDQVLLEHVKMKIDEKEAQLGLREIELDCSKVNWKNVVRAASYRTPPFQAGEKEKGFRDAIVAESFLQLLADSPKSAKTCRVVLVTDDQLLSRAVKERIIGSPNASILAGIEELKGLINTLISNVSEEFIAVLKPKAERMFFVPGDKSTLYFRENIWDRLKEKFKAQLEQKPNGTSFRENKKFYVHAPNFVRKEGRRIFWSSRIEALVEAGTVTRNPEPGLINPGGELTLSQPAGSSGPLSTLNAWPNQASWGNVWGQAAIGLSNLNTLISYDPPDKRIVTHEGRDVYEVLWSTEVTINKELKKNSIDDLKHVEAKWQSTLPVPA
jgi:hypothetical protein